MYLISGHLVLVLDFIGLDLICGLLLVRCIHKYLMKHAFCNKFQWSVDPVCMWGQLN